MIKSPVPEAFIAELYNTRASYALLLPPQPEVQRFVKRALQLLFPHFAEQRYESPQELALEISALEVSLKRLLAPFVSSLKQPLDQVSDNFFSALPSIHKQLRLDAMAIFDGDPAASSMDEVILAYPGFYAIAVHRMAHQLWSSKVPVLPRVLTEYAHQLTGIDIHPGAAIGESFCIDHGTGIVIGETAVIGNHVKLYQGVTLGALSVEKRMAGSKRHPTIEDYVVVYSQATILGGDTVIGHHSVIGGNVWLIQSVPPHSTVYHASDIKVKNSRSTGAA